MKAPPVRDRSAGALAPAAEARRFLHYVAVGLLATAVHYGLLIAAVEGAGWPAWAGSGLGAVVGGQVAYAGNRWFTFAHHGGLARSWLRFQLTALAGAAFGMAVVALGVHWRLHYLLAQVLATGATALLTYAINRRWAFATRPDRA